MTGNGPAAETPIQGAPTDAPTSSDVDPDQTLTLDAPLVLILDDDPDIRVSLADLFSSVDLASAAFGSTQELLAFTLPDRPMCLVLDLRLPGASGLDLQATLTRMDVHIPIIFITGHADVPTTVRAMKAGAIDFLSKPFSHQDLLDAVGEALRRDRQRRVAQGEVEHLQALATKLTPREIDVLQRVGRGLLNKQIAFELGISEITVKMHRSSAGRKLGTRSVADMIRAVELLRL
jgi:FixJ family two-component response regulator